MFVSAKNLTSVILLAIITSGCSRLSLDHEIANKGPIRLHETNPYLVSNQFLAEAIKSSPVIDGFIRTEGTPDAIAVKKDFIGPYRTHLYYLQERKAFLMESKGGQAFVKGPARIPDPVYQQLKRITPLSKEAALNFSSGGPTLTTSTDNYSRSRRLSSTIKEMRQAAQPTARAQLNREAELKTNSNNGSTLRRNYYGRVSEKSRYGATLPSTTVPSAQQYIQQNHQKPQAELPGQPAELNQRKLKFSN